MSTNGQPPDPHNPKDGASPEGLPGAIRIMIPLAMALIAGILIVLGIQGAVLEQFIRNHPVAVSLAFGFAIVGLVSPLFARNFDLQSPAFVAISVVGGIFVLIGAGLAIAYGSLSLSDREHPKVSINAALAEPDSKFVDVTVSATALSLRSPEKALVRIVAVVPTGNTKLEDYCRDWHITEEGMSSTGQYSILYWGEAGPNAAGQADASLTFRVSRESYSHVCVYAILGGRDEGSEDARYSVNVLDLDAVVPTATETPE